MKPKAFAFSIFFIVYGLLVGDANAGAWGVGRGKSQIILEAFALQTSEIEDKGALEIYSENGLGRNFSFVNEANIQFETDRALSTLSAHSIKYARPFNNNWSSAIMLGVDAKIIDDESLQVGLGPTARAMLGRGFENGYWINVEGGARERDNEASFFGEIGAGKRFKNQDILLIKYLTEGGYLSNFGSNIQISYAKSISPNWKLDFGFRQSIGNNGRRQNSGILIGIWWQK